MSSARNSWPEVFAALCELWPAWQPTMTQRDVWREHLGDLNGDWLIRAARQHFATSRWREPNIQAILAAFREVEQAEARVALAARGEHAEQEQLDPGDPRPADFFRQVAEERSRLRDAPGTCMAEKRRFLAEYDGRPAMSEPMPNGPTFASMQEAEAKAREAIDPGRAPTPAVRRFAPTPKPQLEALAETDPRLASAVVLIENRRAIEADRQTRQDAAVSMPGAINRGEREGEAMSAGAQALLAYRAKEISERHGLTMLDAVEQAAAERSGRQKTSRGRRWPQKGQRCSG